MATDIDEPNACQMGECPNGNPECQGCPSDAAVFVIWWLTQHDHEVLAAIAKHETWGNLTADWPAWLRREVDSMDGRPRRGRLWNAFPSDWLPDGIPWPKTAIGAYLGVHAGGVVVPLADLHHVIGLPGLVTNTSLDRLLVHGVDIDL